MGEMTDDASMICRCWSLVLAVVGILFCSAVGYSPPLLVLLQLVYSWFSSAGFGSSTTLGSVAGVAFPPVADD